MALSRIMRPRCIRLLAFAAGLALLVLLLCIRPLLADTIDLGSYTKTGDAERYLSLPYSGVNFSANSLPAFGAGRYFLKGKTAATVLEAYARLARSHPAQQYVYGEMGWEGGGRFRPHRTHQQGLSADFMTPVYTVNAKGERQPATLPSHAANLWGYHIRLDSAGRYKDYVLDSAAMIAHLAALQAAAPVYGLRVERVIFDPPLLLLLRKDPAFAAIKNLRFMPNKAWFPHDGHYHVDFAPVSSSR